MHTGIVAHIVVGSPSYSATILADGPLLYYRFEPLCIDLGGGTCLTLDSSGNNFHAEVFNTGEVGGITNPATGLIVAGTDGTCYEFLGFVIATGPGLVQNVNNELHLIGDMTVECWVDMDVFISSEFGLGPTYLAIEQRFSIADAPADADHNYLWSLTVGATGLLGTHHQFGSRSDVFTESTHAIGTGATHHLVIVRDVAAKTITYFDNGVEFDTVVYSDNPTGGSETYMRVGATIAENFARLKGRLDEFAVYDKKLTPVQILSHYNAGIPVPPAPVPSGSVWTERANPKDFNLTAIAYNGTDLYVAAGWPDGTDSYLISSPDGITWTERSNPKNTFINGIVFAEGLFVAVGNVTDAVDAYIITSPDGITWTERTNPEDTRLAAVIHDNGTFIAVGNKNASNEDYIVTSPDGITWTQRDTTGYLGRNLRGLAGDGAGNIVAVGIESCVSSADGGVTWTDRRSNLPNVNLNQQGIVYDGTRFVMLDGGGGGIWTNVTGTTSWTDEVMVGDYIDGNDNGNSIAFNDGVYVISGQDGSTPKIWRSTDFLTWVEQTIVVTGNAALQGVIFGGGLWVSVGADDSAGPDAYINTAP